MRMDMDTMKDVILMLALAADLVGGVMCAVELVRWMCRKEGMVEQKVAVAFLVGFSAVAPIQYFKLFAGWLMSVFYDWPDLTSWQIASGLVIRGDFVPMVCWVLTPAILYALVWSQLRRRRIEVVGAGGVRKG